MESFQDGSFRCKLVYHFLKVYFYAESARLYNFSVKKSNNMRRNFSFHNIDSRKFGELRVCPTRLKNPHFRPNDFRRVRWFEGSWKIAAKHAFLKI